MSVLVGVMYELTAHGLMTCAGARRPEICLWYVLYVLLQNVIHTSF